jgi:carbonic anhydrase
LGSKGLWLQTFVGPKDGGKKHFSSSNNDCGMLTFTDDEFKEGIPKETGLKPEWAAESFNNLASDVLQSISRIKASPFIPHTDAVRGFIVDVASGLLEKVK